MQGYPQYYGGYIYNYTNEQVPTYQHYLHQDGAMGEAEKGIKTENEKS